MRPDVDVIVLGLGAMGSSATFALSRRGQRVVAIEPHEPGHERGSSHGDSRAIRLAYFEHPSYVPLVQAAYDRWRELEDLTGERVLTITGILEAGQPGSAIVKGSLDASRLHGIPHEHLSGRELRTRFPHFDVPDDWSGVYQPDGGFLRPELAIKLYVALARQHGAEIRLGCKAIGLRPERDRVVVETTDGQLSAKKVVVAAGAWMSDLIPELKPHLRLTRQVLCWFSENKPEFAVGRFPVFILDAPEDLVYGFPNIDGKGVKIASHNESGIFAHANHLAQDGSKADRVRLRQVIGKHIPSLERDVRRMRTCIYTRTPDEDFIIDVSQADDRVVIASPCSGHGFKFASVIGDVLADLATTGSTSRDVSRFRIGRFLEASASGG